MKLWFKKLFSSDRAVSSKRLFGAFGFLLCCFIIAVFRHDYVPELLYVSASLLGVESLASIFRRNEPTSYYPPDNPQ